MKTIALMFAMSLSGAAFASEAADEFHAQMQKLGDPAATCVSFAGTWKGTCVTRNVLDPAAALQSREQTVTFKQFGCATMQSDMFGFAPIGVSSSKSEASERGSSTIAGVTKWLDGGNKLFMAETANLSLYDGSLIRRSKTMGEFTREGDVVTGKSTLKIDTLNAADMTVDATKAIEEESTCTLTLQPE